MEPKQSKGPEVATGLLTEWKKTLHNQRKEDVKSEYLL